MQCLYYERQRLFVLTFLMQARASQMLVDHAHAEQAVCAQEKVRACMVNVQCLVDANKLSPLDHVCNANMVVYGIYPCVSKKCISARIASLAAALGTNASQTLDGAMLTMLT